MVSIENVTIRDILTGKVKEQSLRQELMDEFMRLRIKNGESVDPDYSFPLAGDILWALVLLKDYKIIIQEEDGSNWKINDLLDCNLIDLSKTIVDAGLY